MMSNTAGIPEDVQPQIFTDDGCRALQEHDTSHSGSHAQMLKRE